MASAGVDRGDWTLKQRRDMNEIRFDVRAVCDMEWGRQQHRAIGEAIAIGSLVVFMMAVVGRRRKEAARWFVW